MPNYFLFHLEKLNNLNSGSGLLTDRTMPRIDETPTFIEAVWGTSPVSYPNKITVFRRENMVDCQKPFLIGTLILVR
jgi:hypothetical protein